MMKLEIRADGVHISGYVNATEKKSCHGQVAYLYLATKLNIKA